MSCRYLPIAGKYLCDHIYRRNQSGYFKTYSQKILNLKLYHQRRFSLRSGTFNAWRYTKATMGNLRKQYFQIQSEQGTFENYGIIISERTESHRLYLRFTGQNRIVLGTNQGILEINTEQMKKFYVPLSYLPDSKYKRKSTPRSTWWHPRTGIRTIGT